MIRPGLPGSCSPDSSTLLRNVSSTRFAPPSPAATEAPEPTTAAGIVGDQQQKILSKEHAHTLLSPHRSHDRWQTRQN
jgi:hypothetical protein